MKLITLIFITCLNIKSTAQIISATLNIGGLTCSLCSSGVEYSIKKLEFADKVEMNLNTNTAFVIFKKDKEVLLTKLVENVKDAGFSVTSLYLKLNLDTIQIKNGETLLFRGHDFHFIEIGEKIISGYVVVRVIHKDTMTSKEYAPYRNLYNPKKYVEILKKENLYYLTI